MKKFLTLLSCIIASLLMLHQEVGAQVIYQVLDQKIVMESAIKLQDGRDVRDVPEAFNRFVNNNGGYVKGSYFSGTHHQFADMLTPVLHVGKYSASLKALLHVDNKVVDN